jgi:hypothetical protein
VLNTYIHDLLEETAADIYDGAAKLKLTLSDFAQTEAEILQELNAHTAMMDRPAQSPVTGDGPADDWDSDMPDRKKQKKPEAIPDLENMMNG